MAEEEAVGGLQAEVGVAGEGEYAKYAKYAKCAKFEKYDRSQ